MSQPSTRLYGPLISTSDLDAHQALFCDVFGMEVAGCHQLGDDDARALFGDGFGDEPAAATVVVLETPGMPHGVVLIAFEPASDSTIRDWGTRTSRDALKVIDFYAPDYEAAIAHARRLGYDVIDSGTSYDLPEGTFREAHLWGPDNVVTAFLGGPADFFADFAQIGDRLVSEVQSISAPLSNGEESVVFYRDVFGWECVYEYAIDDPSFAKLVGVDELTLRSRNVGPSTREPYFGLIDYGLPEGSGGSLHGRSAAPRRGLLGAVLVTDDLDGVVAAAGLAAGPTVSVPLLDCTHAAGVTTPHSVPHLLLGRSRTALG